MPAYDVIPIVDMGPGKAPAPAQRIVGLDAKAAARLAVRVVRGQVETARGFSVVRAHVVPEGASAWAPAFRCVRHFPAGPAASRARRLAVERRGGVWQGVRCESLSPAFRLEIATKKRRRKPPR